MATAAEILEFQSTTEWLRISDIEVDMRYQRTPGPGKIKSIADNFNEVAAGTPAVNVWKGGFTMRWKSWLQAWLHKLQQPALAVISMKDLANWAFEQGKMVQRKLYEADMGPYLKRPYCFEHDVPVPLWKAAPGFYECPFCRKAELPQPVPALSALAQAAGTEHELPAVTGEFARAWNKHHKAEEQA